MISINNRKSYINSVNAKRQWNLKGDFFLKSSILIFSLSEKN